MTEIELAALVTQYTGLTDRADPAYAQAYRLAHAVATAALDDTVHLLASPTNAARLERSLAQLAAGEAKERELIVLVDVDDDPGNIPHYQGFQALMDDMLDQFPPEVLDTTDTPEGLLLDCITEAMIRYETKYWPMDDEPETRKEFPSPAEDGQ